MAKKYAFVYMMPAFTSTCRLITPVDKTLTSSLIKRKSINKAVDCSTAHKIISMKKVSFSVVLFAAILLLSSCGGVIGNIEKYSFPNVNSDSLKAALNRVYIKYPELIKPDTTMYGKNNGGDFYYLLNNEKQMEVFQCSVIAYPPPYDKEIDLSLTTATTWGKTMQLASKMGFFEKRKYRKLFEENILPKIKEELKAE